MARKTTQSEPGFSPPVLTETRDSAFVKLQNQIQKGQAIIDQEFGSIHDVETARREMKKWSEYNTELLLRLFDNASVSQEYKTAYVGVSSVMVSLYGPGLPEEIRNFLKATSRYIDKLKSIQGRLELIPEPDFLNETHQSQVSFAQGTNANRVFIVHGHDDAAKLSVSRFLEKIDLVPVVLHEQANASMTIIEKFEANCDVGFAVVILTPDDLCIQKDESKTYRARQNVIFEMGFFVGKIGRKNVCALKKNEVEINSDIHGVTYVPMDDGGAWALLLARELRQAGIIFDASKLL